MLSLLLFLLLGSAQAETILPDCPPKPAADAPLQTMANDSGSLVKRLDGIHLPPPDQVANPRAILTWKDLDDYKTSKIDPSTVPRIKVDCPDQRLFPTNPQESTKEYHVYQQGTYDAHKLTAEDRACLVGSKTVNGLGTKPCFMADKAFHVVISDTYVDSCGNSYRGFWQKTYLEKKEETMGTLFGQGRSMVSPPHPQFELDMMEDGTYSLKPSDFLFLSPLFPGDKDRIEIAVQKAQDQGFQRNGLLFVAPTRH